MFNFIKTLFIKHKISKNHFSIGVKSYPDDIRKVGFLCLSTRKPDANLITKLKTTLGSQTQFLIFVVSDDINNGESKYLNFKCFDLFGEFKDKGLKESLADLDMLIDTTQKISLIKDLAINSAENAYKISLGNYPKNIYNLSIDLKAEDKNLFIDEIIKYHKILSHA